MGTVCSQGVARLRSPACLDTESSVFAERVTEDRARVRRKFFPARPRQVRHTGRSWTNPFTDALAARVRDRLRTTQACPVLT